MSEDQTRVAHLVAGLLGATTVEGSFNVMPFEDMSAEQMSYHLTHLHGAPVSADAGRERLIETHARHAGPVRVAHAHQETYGESR